MTVGELVERLQKLDPNMDICVDIEQECHEISEVETWKSEDPDGSFVSIIVDF